MKETRRNGLGRWIAVGFGLSLIPMATIAYFLYAFEEARLVLIVLLGISTVLIVHWLGGLSKERTIIRAIEVMTGAIVSDGKQNVALIKLFQQMQRTGQQQQGDQQGQKYLPPESRPATFVIEGIDGEGEYDDDYQ